MLINKPSLKSCPFCGDMTTVRLVNHEDYAARVECECGASGTWFGHSDPPYDTQENRERAAVDAWNNRR